MRHKLARAGLDAAVTVDSAGTHAYHSGEPPDPRAISAAKRRGIDLSGLTARCIEPRDFDAHDLIVALDGGHYHTLKRMELPDARAELCLMMDFAPGAAKRDVPDPYYGGAAGFESVLDMIAAASDGLLEKIRAMLAP